MENTNDQVTIQNELLMVKEEAIAEENPWVEVESVFSTHCTKSLSTLEDGDLENDVKELSPNIHVEQTKLGKTIKDEQIFVKEEVNAEEKQLVEVEIVFPKDCTKKESTIEENSDLGNDVKVFPHIHVEQTKLKDVSERSFICNNCHRVYFHKRTFITHLRQCHSKLKGKLYSCTECDMEFNNRAVLTEHKRIHTVKKPFPCNICDKQFNSKSTLGVHMRTHTGEKPFSCNVCNKQFSDKSNLVVHKRIHTGEKPFACCVCDKTFIQKKILVSHTRTHTGEKPFACNVCDKQFNDNSNLAVHMRTHTGEKPFACNICDKQFNQKRHLVAHMRNHTEKVIYVPCI